MSRLTTYSINEAQNIVEGLYKDLERRIIASPPGLCPVDLTSAFLKLCHAQTCGKCVPCRIGLKQLGYLLDDILDGKGTMETLELLEQTATSIYLSADCAIGSEAAQLVIKGLSGFREDYLEHILHHRCTSTLTQPVPCVALCPAGVDIPGYIALIKEYRYADAVSLIRKDNPFPVACAYICEHPCEARCRRNMVDDAINIRGLKRSAVDFAGNVPVPERAPDTGKKIAVIGGGPSGLTAAYYLQLMGHQVTIFEKNNYLGGMLRYGIPNYRLPREQLQRDIDAILSTGIQVEYHSEIGSKEGELTLADLKQKYDAIYIGIGAHIHKSVGIEGENAIGVISAVEMLHQIGDHTLPDFKGKTVCVIGGGNVAMDASRSAIRLGAKKVSIAYRRRSSDMTALKEEVEGALEENVEILDLQEPDYIETDEQNHVTALWTTQKMISTIEKNGRPSIVSAQKEKRRIPCDIVIIAVGQGIDMKHFVESGIPVKGGTIQAEEWAEVSHIPGVFAGGDCVTGPATVIRAIADGKVVAANIDQYLGYEHKIRTDITIPKPNVTGSLPCGRIPLTFRSPQERRNDFDPIEKGMSLEETLQEAARCLRCDYYGYGIFKGGRLKEW